MPAPLSTGAFYDSARGFARTALEAHHDGDYRRVALDAGTALEHLLKACLSKRSRVLVVELKNEASFKSLWQLVEFPQEKPLREVRTVNLRNALERVKVVGVSSKADDTQLRLLADMRDGSVHAAMDDKVEMLLLAAFAQHVDALLADLGRARDDFWGAHLSVVDALLSKAGDEITRTVRVKIEGARAWFADRYTGQRKQFLIPARQVAEQRPPQPFQVPMNCPACKSLGLTNGSYGADWEADDWDEEGNVTNVYGTVWYIARDFSCAVCRLRLDSPAELDAAGLGWRWLIEGFDPEDVFANVYTDTYTDTYGNIDSAMEERLRSRLVQQRAEQTNSSTHPG